MSKVYSLPSKVGFTLVEVVVAVLLSTIALFGIGTLIILANNDWQESREIVALQSDLDLTNYTLKGILEEADEIEIPEEARIIASYKADWKKEFYSDGNKLMLKDIKNPGKPEEEVIDSLKSISFQQSYTNRIKINLEVEKEDKELESALIVYLRNQ